MNDLVDYLEVYLDDHRAGATAGLRLAHRIVNSNRSIPFAADLAATLTGIEGHLELLEEVRTALGVAEGGRLKMGMALALETVSRFKPNRHVITYSPLSRVLELEALMSGVQGKTRLWKTLASLAPTVPALAGFDFDKLERESQAQLATLGEVHEWAARQLAT